MSWTEWINIEGARADFLEARLIIKECLNKGPDDKQNVP